MANIQTPARKLTAAAMDLAALRPWHEITWREIAATAGLTLDQAHEIAADKAGILELLSRQADQAILAAPAASEDGSARDRLFDVMMRRFDALKPHRAGLASVAASAAREPAVALAALTSVGRAARVLLLAAAIPTEGVVGSLRAKGVGAIWLAALRTFLTDESEDLAATMATVDKQLRRAESVIGRLTPKRRKAQTEEPPTATAEDAQPV